MPELVLLADGMELGNPKELGFTLESAVLLTRLVVLVPMTKRDVLVDKPEAALEELLPETLKAILLDVKGVLT